MRALVFLLIFANLVFFAYTRGYFGEETSPDAQRISQQIAPERLVIVSNDQPPAKPAPLPQPPPACVAWKAVDSSTASAIEASATAAGLSVVRGEVPAPSGYWVFIPPQANRAGAERKAGELRELGIREYFIVLDEGPNRYALSLGIFSTEAAANSHLAKLKGNGVRSAIVAPRGRSDQTLSIEARGNAATVAAWKAAWAGAAPADCNVLARADG